jgi:cyclic lactone autoinducer peptide
MKMKLFLATLIASLATIIATTTVGACFHAGFEEPKCPNSLIE